MILGIVGNEAAKFTPEGKRKTLELIERLISSPDVIEVVSGCCHLGGVDIWAQEEAIRQGREFTGFAPKILAWEGGYKQRNLQIAARCDEVHNIVVNRLPDTYDGMRFKCCYHCKGEHDEHVKSGGCWTAKKSKCGIWHIITQ